ncbi:hypothetical protein IU433_31095 [Nocardia puris]|uniref:hypothetical protein n=1 Tax=Nocardia puris TaxID=208602 RepID=UPI001892F49E|nr:hypothetical protein [Nocardia puris]MBF6215358.1 hypothetical protein [Nocardia puris]MBF6369788.1 hypothetical protein [Nocardia puris]MBF6463447.1 hypothetical protein [Nocardia puris]
MGLAIEDLPAATATVLRRRARAAGLPITAYVRAELVARASGRTPEDTIVDFLRSAGRDLNPEIDADASALVTLYDLPSDALAVFGARARAAGLPLGEFARKELIGSARRATVADSLEEFREVMGEDADLSEVAAAIAYARGA